LRWQDTADESTKGNKHSRNGITAKGKVNYVEVYVWLTEVCENTVPKSSEDYVALDNYCVDEEG
jgi:hypothetical protein